ncbi:MULTISPECIES: PAC2 family protein [Brevibacterium]|uniref:Carboxylate--amine ligase n=1 Tax=Brevibacterium luteolum TaxID=199591 RepID=A0A2N6PKM0_9MICO|nr:MULTISPECIES: PAC2 family protein [Brevibacterium]MBM7528671.1 hypothetical protein [Brevibacterium luteolum]MCT1829323.1 PAC2 family protein [Brevibacterium luteolum]MCT1873252.1 PAC2 family protein [Brevibacterium luteolum]MCT1890371.1 PAC2 family protein [Brevibacterium luteolum]MCT1893204.1 PAC2 family protein [Brevibacterium luteolum]
MDFLPPSDRWLRIIAVEGMDDAGQSAVDAAHHLVEAWDLRPAEDLLTDGYYDYTLVRPRLRRSGMSAEVEWPCIETYTGTVPGTPINVIVMIGPEPTFYWADAFEVLLDGARSGDRVVLISGAAAAVSHRRPLPVAVTSEQSDIVSAYDGVESAYGEGTAGLLEIFAVMLAEQRIPAVTLTVSVPGYVAGTTSPKAILSLLGAFEDLTGFVVPQHDLVEDARAWEFGVEEFVEANPDLQDHVEHLESVAETSELPEAKGEAIAREFERYLQHRRRDGS